MKTLSSHELLSTKVTKRWKPVLYLVMILAILLSACKTGVAPTTQPGQEPETSAATHTPAPTPTMAGLPVMDAGSPLPVELVETKPAKGQGLSTAGKIRLTFNQPMDIEKTNAAWSFEDEQGNPVDGEIQWTSARSMEFTPARALKTSNRYLAKLSEKSTSAAGASLKDPLLIEFVTTGPLEIAQVFPADNTRDVANNAVITVIFNRPVVPLVIAEEQKIHPQPLIITPALPGEGEWVSTSVYAYKPNQPLMGDTTYQVSVKAGLADVSGETRLEKDTTWKFTTISPSIDNLSLSSGKVNPENFLQNVLLDEIFTLSFFQPMDKTSTEAALKLVSANGEKVPTERVWNENATQVVITPTTQLSLDTQYTLTLDENARSADGGSLSKGLEWSFYTIPAPAVIETRPKDGSQTANFSSELTIRFASPMKIETLKDKIQITPAPQKPLNWWYSEWDWSYSSYGLEPSTRYEVRLLPGMQDIYGNEIKESRDLRFNTGSYEPGANLEMPWEPAIMRQDGPQEFYVGHRNVKSVQVRIYKIGLEDFIALQSGALSFSSYEPEESELVWQETRTSQGKQNERVLEKFTPVANGGNLANGFYFLALNSPQVTYNLPYADNRLFIVATASLNLKSSASDGLVWLTGLGSGKPVGGVAVKILDENLKVIGQGQTDAEGLLYIDPLPLEEEYGARFALAENDQEFAFTSTQWGSGFSLWDYGIWGGYFSPANQPTVYVYTERPIYRPGQPVYFKGIARLDDDLDYRIPDMKRVRITIENFQEVVLDEMYDLNDMGSFAGEFKLDENAALGYYTISVYLEGSTQIAGAVTFNVAEYRRPEFQVQVSAIPEDLLNGEEFRANVQADYYSGGGVKDAQVKWTLVSAPFTFTPPEDLSMFSFSDQDEYRDLYNTSEQQDTIQVAEGEGQTDQNGAFSIALPVDLSPSGLSREFTFEATLTDISQNAVSGRAVIAGHRAQVYPGIRPKNYIGKAGDEQTLEMVAVDWDGEVLGKQKLSLEIVERRWYSVQEQDPEGRVKWTSSVEEIPVITLEDLITNERGRVEASFTPPAGGIYRARVKGLDSKGNEGRASAYVWVAGEDFIPWRQTNDRSFDLVADRKNYAPGDTAEILIASPFEGEAYALVTVERGKVHYQDVVLLQNNSTIYQLPIVPEMAPNVFVSVVIVKGVDETNPRPNFKMGMLEIQVDPQQKALTVEISADPTQAGPGETVRFTVATKDHTGAPVPAEVSLGLSDLATLSLMPDNSLPILEHFYSRRTLGVWTSVPISMDIEDFNLDISEQLATGEGMGSGGAKGEGDLGVIEVRQDFPDTAFWEAFVITGEDGLASVSLTLPDNLTTWRMDARAVTETTLVGQATYDLMSTKPLLVRPQTPRFFVAGDQVRLGAAIHNNTLNALTVTARLGGSGVDVAGPVQQEIQVGANSQVYVTWDSVVQPMVERVDLVFSVTAGDLSDASRPTTGSLDNQGIPVYRYEVPETVATSGMLTQSGSILEAISLPEAWETSQGRLDLTFSPSLAAGVTDGLTYLENYPYECIEQTISRFLPNVLTTQALKTAGLSDPALEADLKEQVASALQKLYNWQNANGGWGWWRSSKSDPLTSAYVVLGLVEAEDAGYQVSSDVLQRGVRYLQTQTSASVTTPQHINRQAFLFYTLARAGKPNVSSSIALFEKRQNAAYYARAYMAHTLYLIDPQDSRLDTLLSDLNSAAILSATGSHWEEKETDRWNWNTDTRTTAIVLSALSLIDPQNPLNANAVRWLMSNRQGGHWRGTQETAWTLMALTHWMSASGELQANYKYGVALNGEQIGGGEANKKTLRQTERLQVDITDLLTEEANRLVIARNDGAGNLYYTAAMNVWLPVDQVQALDQGLTVSRSYYRLDDLQTPVTQAVQGELLLGRLTLVAPAVVHYAVVEDPLPAGLEAVDQSLNTSPQNQEVPQEYTWEDVFWKGWGWWHFSQVQYRDEKVLLFADYLPAGTYIYTYLVRASSVGTFSSIPPTAQEFYFPEVYGRGEGSTFVVEPAE